MARFLEVDAGVRQYIIPSEFAISQVLELNNRVPDHNGLIQQVNKQILQSHAILHDLSPGKKLLSVI